MEAAREWGLTPGQWFEVDEWERATMMAYLIVTRRLEYYVRKWRN